VLTEDEWRLLDDLRAASVQAGSATGVGSRPCPGPEPAQIVPYEGARTVRLLREHWPA
jgi:hypothetical protein